MKVLEEIRKENETEVRMIEKNQWKGLTDGKKSKLRKNVVVYNLPQSEEGKNIYKELLIKLKNPTEKIFEEEIKKKNSIVKKQLHDHIRKKKENYKIRPTLIKLGNEEFENRFL